MNLFVVSQEKPIPALLHGRLTARDGKTEVCSFNFLWTFYEEERAECMLSPKDHKIVFPLELQL